MYMYIAKVLCKRTSNGQDYVILATLQKNHTSKNLKRLVYVVGICKQLRLSLRLVIACVRYKRARG